MLEIDGLGKELVCGDQVDESEEESGMFGVRDARCVRGDGPAESSADRVSWRGRQASW